MIIGNFNTDFFVVTTNPNPMIVVTEGFEDRIYINGISLTGAVKNVQPTAKLDSSTTIYYIPGQKPLSNVKRVEARLESDTRPPYTDEKSQIIYYSNKINLKSVRITPTYPKERADTDASYYDSVPLNKVKEGSPITGKYELYENLFHIHIESDEACSINLLDIDPDTEEVSENLCEFDPGKDFDRLLKYRKTKNMIGPDVSYELLRANPKLTGNVKVVVDSNSNIYLDTFKVSTGLSQMKYRKIKVNPDEYYGRTLMAKFKGMPTDDFYKIEDSCYKLFSTANNLGEQYYDKYNSGVRTNGDKLYPENYALLAPLCIKKTLPDFFVVFKVKNYEGVSSDNRAKHFLSNGEIVKVYDMRKDSPLGKYVRNIQEHARNFVGDVYVAYDYEQDNIFNGISLDRGVVAGIHESASLERDLKNQVAMNDWYSLGFERNRIVSKDIINLEFMFDDVSEKLFSINTYFGLYIKLNGEDEDFSCLSVSGNGATFDSSIHGTVSSGFIPTNYPTAIYGMSTKDSFYRLKYAIDSSFNKSILQKYALVPDKNISSPEIIPYPDEYYGRCYSSVKLYDTLEPGEHYRIIDRKNKLIFEVIASNINNGNFEISEVSHKTDEITGYKIQSISIYGIDYRKNISEEDKISVIYRQTVLISKAFNSFDTDKIISYYGESSFSIIYDESFVYGTFENSVLIEKICWEHAITDDEKSVLESTDDNSFIFMGDLNLIPIILDSQSDDVNMNILYPTWFGVLGYRKGYCSMFIPINSDTYLIRNDITDSLSSLKTVIYRTTNVTTPYKTFEGFTVYSVGSIDGSELKSTEVKDVPGFGNEESYIVKLNDPMIINGKCFFYSNSPINAGLCSIFQIKDFDFNVLDPNNTIWYKNGKKIPGATAGIYTETNNAIGKAIKNSPEERITSYLDKYERYKSYTIGDVTYDFLNETLTPISASYYLNMMSSDDHKASDISLISPYCCKWKHESTDFVGNPLRVMFDFRTDSINSSYFLTDDSSYYVGVMTAYKPGEQIGYSEKYTDNYLTSEHGTYISKNIFFGDGKIEDVLKSGAIKNMSVAHTYGNNVLEFTSGGVKIKIESKNNNVINLSKYNNYSAILIGCADNNVKTANPCDVLIDEVNENVVIIYYCGTSTENYGSLIYTEFRPDYLHVIADKVYRTLRYSKLTECSFGYINMSKKLIIPDDASYYDDTTLYPENNDAYIFLTSSRTDSSSYTLESYNLITSKFLDSSGHPYNEEYENSLVTDGDAHLFADSSVCQNDNSSIKKNFKKRDEFVDGFIAIPNNDGVPVHNCPKPVQNLSQIKSLLESPAVFVKTINGTLNYTGAENLLEISVLPYSHITREYSDFEKTNIEGNVYPEFAEPLKYDILKFRNDSSTPLDILCRVFDSNLYDSNILIGDQNENSSDHNLTGQMWLRKYAVNKLNENTYVDSSSDPVYYTLKSLALPPDEIYPDKIENGSEIYQIDDDLVKTYVVENSPNAFAYNGPILHVILYGGTYNTYYENPLESVDFNLKNATYYCDVDGRELDAQILKVYDVIIDSSNNHITKLDIDVAISEEWSGSWTEDVDYFNIYDEKYPYNEIISAVNIEPGSMSDSSLATYTSDYIYIRRDDYSDVSINFDSDIKAPMTGDELKASKFYINLNDSSYYFYMKDDSMNHQDSSVVYKEEGKDVLRFTSAIDALPNFDPFTNCWEKNIYRTYYNYDSYTSEKGIDAAYEMNTFIASRGINLNGVYKGEVVKKIELGKWFDSNVDKINKRITLNITNSLINMMLFTEGYSENWEGKDINDVKSKSKYIKNSILKYIKIDKTCKVSVYKVNYSKELYIQDYEENLDLVEVQNIKNNLYEENDMYYIRFEDLEDSGYVIKFEILL